MIYILAEENGRPIPFHQSILDVFALDDEREVSGKLAGDGSEFVCQLQNSSNETSRLALSYDDQPHQCILPDSYPVAPRAHSQKPNFPVEKLLPRSAKIPASAISLFPTQDALVDQTAENQAQSHELHGKTFRAGYEFVDYTLLVWNTLDMTPHVSVKIFDELCYLV